MSFRLGITLLSGKCASIEVDPQDSLDVLRQQAQIALGVGRSSLVSPSGEDLRGARTVKDTGLSMGDTVTLQTRPVQVFSSRRSGAFAAILGDGSVVSWGSAGRGGNSSAVHGQLRNVQHIQASGSACAAVLGDGSVVTWGRSDSGGDSSAVQGQLRKVQHIQASLGAFAAVPDDGSVVTWGDSELGGDSSAVQGQLRNVHIQASGGAFAAVLGDGSVVTWGNSASGGDSKAVEYELRPEQHPNSGKA
jgi:hypothetical protein